MTIRPSEMIGRTVYFGRRKAKVIGAELHRMQVVFDGAREVEYRYNEEITEVEVPMRMKPRYWCLWVDPDVDILDDEGNVIDHGACFYVRKPDGKDHLVGEWRGDGIATDTIFAERPALEYGVTTTPHQRCVRMALELLHWPLTSALLVGPGDGVMETAATRGERGEVLFPMEPDEVFDQEL